MAFLTTKELFVMLSVHATARQAIKDQLVVQVICSPVRHAVLATLKKLLISSHVVPVIEERIC